MSGLFKTHWTLNSSTLILIFLMTINGVTASATQNSLEKIGFSTLPGNRVQVNLNFTGTAPMPVSFSTDNPARIVLDFPGVAMNLKARSQNIGIGAVQGTGAVEAGERTRVVLELIHSVPYNIKISDNQVLVEVDNITKTPTPSLASDPLIESNLKALSTSATTIASTSTLPAASGTLPLAVASLAPETSTISTLSTAPIEIIAPIVSSVPSVPSIQDVEFRRTEEGAGRVSITLSDPSIVVNMTEQSDDIILDFLNAALPKKLDRRLDVVDFATPITFVDTLMQGGNARVIITATSPYEHLAYQSDNLYVIEVKKSTEVKETALDKPQVTYSGQKVSFNFQNIDVRAALLLLTDLPGLNLNMVATEAVNGNISLRLRNVPWDQALDIILEAKGLGKRQIGNVLIIDLRKNINEREQAELAAKQEIKKLEPVRTEYITVNYGKASDFAALLGGAQNKNSFLSDRGSVSVDARTNTLILLDTAEKLTDIRQLITALDVPERQVLIESRVVIAEDSFSKSLGVKFGYSGNQDLGNDHGIVVGGKVGGDTQYSGDTAFTSGNTTPSGTGAKGENLIVSLPSNVPGSISPAVGLAIGKIGSYLLQLELSALQVEGRGEIISSPRVVTGNQQKATILQGREVPVQGTAGVGATAAPPKEALLKLEVTPQITPDDRIIMELNVSKNDLISADGAISRREVQTRVLVDNGETVVLGGVYEQTNRDEVKRVPFFSDLPLIGNLFKTNFNKNDKSELLIFVTPKIIKETS